MIIAYLIALSASRKLKIQVTKNVKIRSLQSFGFDVSGYFDVHLSSSGKFRSEFFLVPKSQYDQLDLSSNALGNICNHTNSSSLRHFSYKYKYFNHLSKYNFQSKVFRKGVYVPVVLNCDLKDFSVELTTRNSNSYLDYRDKHLPLMYTVSCIVATTISLCWVLNGICFRHFSVTSHKLFLLSALLYALSRYLKAKYWITLTISDYASVWLSLISYSFEIFSIAFLLTVNSLVSFGYGVLSENFEHFSPDFSSNFLSSIIICLSRDILDLNGKATFQVIVFIFSMFSMLNYSDYVATGMFIANNLLYDVNNEFTHIVQKCKLVMKFDLDLSLFLLSFLIALVYNFIMEPYYSYRALFETMHTFLLLYLDMHYFLYRSSYEGSEEQNQIEPEVESNLTYINDPNQADFAFVSHEVQV